MAFCEDCGKRATCKAICKELNEHLNRTCRAKNSVSTVNMPSNDIEGLAANGRVSRIMASGMNLQLQKQIGGYGRPHRRRGGPRQWED